MLLWCVTPRSMQYATIIVAFKIYQVNYVMPMMQELKTP